MENWQKWHCRRGLQYIWISLEIFTDFCPDTAADRSIQDMSEKFQMYGNSTLVSKVLCLPSLPCQ